jgi:alginate O-acetyltransferase complex protein AlgI
LLFTTPQFLVFFVLYFALHILVPARWRILLVVAGGSLFYSYWHAADLFLLHGLVIASFIGVWWMARAESEQDRKHRLFLVIVLLLLPLGYVKYADFFLNQVVGPLVGVKFDIAPVPLPLGISFITFTLIAYAVEVCRKRYPVVTRWPLLAGYVTFFPHLIAGPILRPRELMPQLQRARQLRMVQFLPAITLFSIGLFKKLAIADPIAVAIDPIFSDPAGRSAAEYLLAIYGFSIQIYCDFSGYTDMALALAALIGIRLPHNFRQPYAASSVADFWRRWHITLSHWLRDYLYIPLGGNRRGPVLRMVAVMVTMLLGGLWHGASWSFVLWGGVHGAGIIVGQAARQAMRRMPNWLGVLITFHFVTAAWILFRAPNLAVAAQIASGPFTAAWGDLLGVITRHAGIVALIVVVLVMHRWDDYRRVHLFAHRLHPAILIAGLLLLWLLTMSLRQEVYTPFIYFDF